MESRKRRQGNPARRKLKFNLSLLVLAILFGLHFQLSAQNGETTESWLYHNTKLMDFLIHVTPDNLRIPYKGNIVENKEGIAESIRYSGGTATYSSSQNSSIIIPFEGESVEWIGSLGQYNGIVNLFIDGQYKASVDLYSIEEKIQTMYKSENLAFGNHVFVIQASGTKNEDAKGYGILLDFIKVTRGGHVTIIDDRSEGIQYKAPNQYYYIQFIVRKLIHVFMFFGITIIYFIFLRINNFKRIWYMLAPLFITAWAILDEYHQSFVSNRHASFVDIVLDTSGMLLASICYFTVIKGKHYFTQKKDGT